MNSRAIAASPISNSLRSRPLAIAILAFAGAVGFRPADTAAQDASTATSTAPASAAGRFGGGEKLLTLDMIYGPEGRVDFDGSWERGFTWLPDGQHYLKRMDGALKKVDAETGEDSPAFDSEALKTALAALEEFDDDAAERISRRPGTFTADRSAVLIEHGGGLYLYRFESSELVRITKESTRRRLERLSPATKFVSFVRDNNLYTLEVASGAERQLTHDGSDTLLNGVLDWVYQEEVYGRGDWQGYWWSHDDAHIAYLQLDESKVPVFAIADQLPQHSEIENTNYPKAGDPNPTVKLGVVTPDGEGSVWVDLSAYADEEILIVRVSWSPDGKLFYQVQNREQTWLDLNEADPGSGEARTLFRETTPAWVNVLGDPKWLKDGSFLWFSERDGYQHLYRYARDGRLLGRVTEGEWELREYKGIDEQDGWVYFSATKDSTIQSHSYRAPLAGGEVQRLTEPGFSHDASFDPQFKYFIDTFSNATTPTKVYLRRSDGSLVRVLSENEVATLSEYKLSTPRYLRIPASDGHLLNAVLILPTDFEEGRRYPVWSTTYAGPHAPVVSDSWHGNGAMLDQMLAQKGYLVWACDPRSASGESAKSTWHAYKRLGETELADLEDGIQWLVDQGYADPERIGIHGYSYGGFMVSYALTHGSMYTLGIAGGSVTDWRNYDSIYTERYMMTPASNPEGYDSTSVVKAAADLHGRLLLVHGALDDNVHLQNTYQLIYELQKAEKQFDLMIYPRDRHGIGHGRRHYIELQIEYIYEKL